MKIKESHIVHDRGNYWVLKASNGYLVMKEMITHSVSEGDVYYPLTDDGLSIAKARCDWLHDYNAGYQEGDKCGREGCTGTIKYEPSEYGCTCFISAPCSSCMHPGNYCPVCDWQEADEV